MNTFVFPSIILYLFLILIMISKFIYGMLVNPVSIYTTMWLGFTFISCLGLWDMYKPSTNTLTIILISVFSFAIISFLTYIFLKRKSGKMVIRDHNISNNHSYFILVIFNLIAMAYLMKFVVKMIPILLTNNWMLVRYYYLNASIDNTVYSTHQALICQWIVFPIVYSTAIISSYLMAKQRTNMILVLISTLGTILIVLATAGRNPLFKILFFYVISFIFQSDHHVNVWKKIKETNIFVKILAVCGIGVIIYIGSHRSMSSNAGVLQNIFYYFTGPIIYFDYIIKNPEQFDLFSSPFFGRATFGFITTPVQILYSIITGTDYTGVDNIITTYVNRYIYFSPTIRGNAVSTALYPFIKDFGYLGLIIGPAILAILVSWVYTNATTMKGIKNIDFWNCMMIYMLYVVFFSEWQYELLFPQSSFIIFMLYMFTQKYNKTKASGLTIKTICHYLMRGVFKLCI